MGKAVAVNRSKKYEHIVQKLTGEKGHIFPESGKKLFPTIRELLTFAAFLGVSRGERLPFDPDYDTEDIQGVIYEDTEALEFIWFIALQDSSDVSLLHDGNEKRCVEIFEQYANYGLNLIFNDLSDVQETEWPSKIVALCHPS